MRNIEGYVCLAISVNPQTNLKVKPLFGPNTGGSDFSHQNITTNGLVPFKSLAEAEATIESIKERKDELNITEIFVEKLKMEITESDDEIFLIRDKRNFMIVVPFSKDNIELLGQGVERARMEGLLVSPLERNGYRTIRGLNKAGPTFPGALYEVRRQMTISKATLGTFEMIKVKY